MNEPMNLPEPPSDELKARILAAAHQTAAPIRRTVRTRVVLLLSVVALVIFGAFHAEGGIHWSGRPPYFIIGTGIGWAVIAFVASWLGARRGRSMVGRPSSLLWTAAVGTPVLLFVWSLLWNFLYPETFHVCADRIGLVCLDLTLTIASLPLLALVVWRSRGDPVHPGATGAALGAAMGAWAALTITLSCECTNPAHVLLGHVFPVVLLVAAGFAMGRWVALSRPPLRTSPHR
jgi:hypothetical protein